MSQNPEMPLPVNSAPTLTTCSNCHSPMPSELRFCRNCGFRLGDGVAADYTETVRFGDVRGPLAPGTVSAPMPVRKRRKFSGMTWVFIGLLVFFIGAAAFTAMISPIRNRVGVVVNQSAKKSYAGVKVWTDADVGVSFEAVTPPGGPADKAGLVGGDVITRFDGQPVKDKDDINRLMVNTPPGKTVEVEYIRDGENLVTKLTTMTEVEIKHLTQAFEERPREQRPQFGYDGDRVERVELPGPRPGTKIFGVQLNEILNSRPADLAGIKEGDIVIAWDDIPIRTPQEFLMRVQRAVPYNTVNLTIMRGDEKLVIPVKMGRQ